MQQIWLTLAIAVGYFFLGMTSPAYLHFNHYITGFWWPSGFVVALAIQQNRGIVHCQGSF
ncbi:MAG: hypothetical protein ACK58N_04325 [Synechocystis sp.]